MRIEEELGDKCCFAGKADWRKPAWMGAKP